MGSSRGQGGALPSPIAHPPPTTPCLRQGGEEHVVIRHHHLHLRVAALGRQEVSHLNNGGMALSSTEMIIAHGGV